MNRTAKITLRYILVFVIIVALWMLNFRFPLHLTGWWRLFLIPLLFVLIYFPGWFIYYHETPGKEQRSVFWLSMIAGATLMLAVFAVNLFQAIYVISADKQPLSMILLGPAVALLLIGVGMRIVRR